jgi:hypothetical protein
MQASLKSGLGIRAGGGDLRNHPFTAPIDTSSSPANPPAVNGGVHSAIKSRICSGVGCPDGFFSNCGIIKLLFTLLISALWYNCVVIRSLKKADVCPFRRMGKN